MSDLLAIQNLVVEYPVGGGRHVHAVSDVTLSVKQGETLGLVGESGSGKSSLARALLQLPPPKAGAVVFDGQDLTKMRGQALRAVRPRLQMIFQDPIASLNPRRRVAEIIAEPLIVSGVSDAAERTRRVRAVMEAVGLDPDLVWNRRPHEFSGGQCQRIAIARALVLEPSLIVCDEPVSALDVSIRAQIVNLLEVTDLMSGGRLEVGVGPGGGHVSRPALRSGRFGLVVCHAGASLHGGADGGDSGTRSRRASGRYETEARRPALSARSALGLPFPHALPACAAALHGRGATAAPDCGGPRGRLPLPAGRLRSATASAPSCPCRGSGRSGGRSASHRTVPA